MTLDLHTVPGKGTYGFDPISHTYWKNGNVVPGSTRVLGTVGVAVDFEGMCERLPPAAAANIRHKRDIGQAVHRASHYVDQDDLAIDTVDPQIAGYLTGWLRLREELGFVPVLLETPLVSWLYAYGGTPDRVGYFTKPWHPALPVGALVTGDLKTGDPEDAAAQFQTGSYQNLIGENFAAGVLNGKWEPAIGTWERDYGGADGITRAKLEHAPRCSFALHPDGSYQVHIYTGGRDFRRFCAHLQTYWDQHQRRKD